MTSQNVVVTVWLLHCNNCNNIVVIPEVLVLVMKTFYYISPITAGSNLFSFRPDGDDDDVKISLYWGKESL